MIVYFANRGMDILGLASTELRGGFTISDDDKYEDIDTGVTQFECTIHWDEDTRLLAKTCTEAGNYLLRSNGDEHEFYTIIEVEEDTKEQATYIYAEDAGMDLLNETVGAFAADSAHPVKWYIETFAEDSGFEIGINEISSLSRKLEWTGEATVAERIASVATQFDNAEIGYSFTIDRLVVTHKYINVYAKRGQDAGVTLRLNREVDRIVTTTSVADLATALYVTGGTKEGEEEPVTLEGYVASESDGDIYTNGDGLVKSKSALAIWSRYVNPSETGTGEGHIVHQWSYDTTSQSELYNRAVTQLKKVYTPAVNYDIEITNMPDNVGIGDYVYIVDEGGEVYLQARVLQMETSVCNETQRLTLGDYVINSGGLSSQVGTLTTQISSLQSQATSTAADVYNLGEEVSELSSSTVKSSDSVSITLSNNYGTATGTLRFSSGMSLSLSALFSDYATQSWVENKNYISTSDSVGLTISNSYGSASGTLRFSSGLSLDIKDLFSSYALLSTTAQIRLYSDYGYAYAPFGFQSPLDMSIQNLLPDLSDYATQQWVLDQIGDGEYIKKGEALSVTFRGDAKQVQSNISYSNSYTFDLRGLFGDSGNYLFYDSNEKQTKLAPNNGQSGTGFIEPYVEIEDNDQLTSDWSKAPFSTVYANGFIGNNLGIDASFLWSRDSDATMAIWFLGAVLIKDGVLVFDNADFTYRSDRALKKNIKALDGSVLDEIEPVSFNWKEGKGDDKKHYGYIANDVKEVLPEIVSDREDGKMSMNYMAILPLLHAKVRALEERIAKLEAIIYGEKERD